MKTKTFNIIITILIWSLFAFIGFTAAKCYTPEPEPKPVDQTETYNVWKQAVQTEYQLHNITYKGGETK